MFKHLEPAFEYLSEQKKWMYGGAGHPLHVRALLDSLAHLLEGTPLGLQDGGWFVTRARSFHSWGYKTLHYPGRSGPAMEIEEGGGLEPPRVLRIYSRAEAARIRAEERAAARAAADEYAAARAAVIAAIQDGAWSLLTYHWGEEGGVLSHPEHERLVSAPGACDGASQAGDAAWEAFQEAYHAAPEKSGWRVKSPQEHSEECGWDALMSVPYGSVEPMRRPRRRWDGGKEKLK